MPNQPNKTLEEKRLEAQRALEGEDRRKKREKEEREIREEKERIRRAEERMLREEEERRMREDAEKKAAEERRRAEEKRKIEEEERRRAEEERRGIEEAEKSKRREEEIAARQAALLKQLRPQEKVGVAGEDMPAGNQEKDAVIQRAQVKAPQNKSTVPRIRTYEGDAAEAVKAKDGSLAKISLAKKAEDRKIKMVRKEPATRSVGMKAIVMVVILTIVLTSAGALAYQLNKKGVFSALFSKEAGKEAPRAPEAPITQSLVTANTETAINMPEDRESALAIIAREMRETSGTDNIKNIYLVETVGALISGTGELLSVWPHTMPSGLARSLNSPFMLGIYSRTPGNNIPFLIFTTSSYEYAFAGMFGWENTIYDDFYTLFGIEKKDLATKIFRDATIGGKDVRMFRNPEGEMLLMHAFADNNTVIITTGESAFIKILSELNR